jgi:hypothetical protein
MDALQSSSMEELVGLEGVPNRIVCVVGEGGQTDRGGAQDNNDD